MEIIQTIEKGVVKLTAPEGHCLIRTSENEDEEKTYTKVAFLAEDDSIENWELIEPEYVELPQSHD